MTSHHLKKYLLSSPTHISVTELQCWACICCGHHIILCYLSFQNKLIYQICLRQRQFQSFRHLTIDYQQTLLHKASIVSLVRKWCFPRHCFVDLHLTWLIRQACNQYMQSPPTAIILSQWHVVTWFVWMSCYLRSLYTMMYVIIFDCGFMPITPLGSSCQWADLWCSHTGVSSQVWPCDSDCGWIE